jgi:molecular chaperone GrpE
MAGEKTATRKEANTTGSDSSQDDRGQNANDPSIETDSVTLEPGQTTPNGTNEAGPDDEAKVGESTEDENAVQPDGEPEEKESQPLLDPNLLRIQLLQRRLEASEEQLRVYIKAHKKAQAEFEAYKTRLERDKETQIASARVSLLQEFTDVADNLERSLEASSHGTATLTNLEDGLRLVHRMFSKAMENLGLERFDPTGLDFDPNCMEALGTIPVTNSEDVNKVIVTLKAGFRVGDVELRPALVQVGRKN